MDYASHRGPGTLILFLFRKLRVGCRGSLIYNPTLGSNPDNIFQHLKSKNMSFEFEKLSVLIVEDTVPMQKLVTSVLETLGVGHILKADDGDTGFDVFCAENPDIIIADWHMTPTSGIEMVEKIRNDPKSPNRTVPIIMMTGYSAMPRVAEARDTGATEFLVKPFSANDLARRIAYVINKPRDFIKTPDYFGPDRRRRVLAEYKGPFRRSSDAPL